MSIIAIDPGSTCGVFEFNMVTGSVYHAELEPYTTVYMLDKRTRAIPIDAIVIERYSQQSTKLTPQHDALMTIGAVRYIAQREGWRVIMQSRADKSRVPTEVLHLIGWWASRRTHSNDAAKHALISMATINPQHPIMQRVAGMIIN